MGARDSLVLAGSLAARLPSDTYGRILDRIAGRGILTAVDTAGRSLLEALKGRPFLIKPNRDELEELFAERADEPERLAALAGGLQEMGCPFYPSYPPDAIQSRAPGGRRFCH